MSPLKTLIPTLLSLVLFTASCSYVERIKDGSMAYDRKQYSVATEMLAKEFAKSKSRVERGQLAYYLGKSWTAIGENDKAIEWFKKSYDNAYGEKALISYAYALKQDEQYEEAAQAFEDVGIETGDPITFRKEIAACQYALEWKNTPNIERSFDVVAATFNSSSNDYAALELPSSQIIFSSDREASTGDATYNWTGNGFSDFFTAQDGSVDLLEGIFNTPDNEGTISFNRDQTFVVFSRCTQTDGDDTFCRLYQSTKEDGRWSNPTILSFTEEEVNYGHPALNEDGTVLYFSSNHPDGWGGTDLYRAVKVDEEWNEPVILPLRLNTIENEEFPFIIDDTLYFSSTGHGGMGALDIYKTYIRKNGDWAPVENLKYPINSGGDDFAFTVSTSQNGLKKGHFSSNRKDGQGLDDIYSYEEKIPILPEPEVVVEEEPIAEQEENTPKTTHKLIIQVYQWDYASDNDPKSKLNTKSALPNATVSVLMNESINLTTNEKGEAELMIDEEGVYKLTGAADGYLISQTSKSISFANTVNGSEALYKAEITLDKLFKNVEITLDNIYYDLNKWDIREDAKPTLLQLADDLKLNSTLRIQLSSHTDCRGEDPYNETLSQKRAQSAVDYLISQGIASNRMIAKGYGESRPADLCECSSCTEEQHQSNRRTTFKIID